MIERMTPDLSLAVGMSHIDMPACGSLLPGFTLAEGDIGQLVIWVVIFLFYGLAQILQKGKKKKPGGRPGVPRPRPGTSNPQDELKEFLESLGTSSAEEDNEPVFEPPPLRAPAQVVPPPPPQPPPVYTREKQVSMPPRPAPRPRAASDLAAAHSEKVYHRTAAPRSAASHWEDSEHFSHATVSAKSFMVSTQSMKMPPVLVSTARTPHGHQIGGTKPALRGRRALRQAMVHQIVLGIPRGLKEDWIFST